MSIRLAQAEDANALARVIVDTGRAAHRGQMPDHVLIQQPLEEAYAESARNWARSLGEIAAADTPQECIYVAEDETGAIVGLGMAGPPKQEFLEKSGEVYVLYVQGSHQHRGLGRSLVRTVAAHLVQLGMTSLLIGCLATNAPARRFYEALGGRVIAERDFDQDGFMLPEVVYAWDSITESRRLMSHSTFGSSL